MEKYTARTENGFYMINNSIFHWRKEPQPQALLVQGLKILAVSHLPQDLKLTAISLSLSLCRLTHFTLFELTESFTAFSGPFPAYPRFLFLSIC